METPQEESAPSLRKQRTLDHFQSVGVVFAILFGFFNLYLHCDGQSRQERRWNELDSQRDEDRTEREKERLNRADSTASAAIRLYWDDPSLASASEIMRLRKIYPDHIPLMVTEAAIRLEHYEFDIASDLLEEIRDRDPDNIDGLTYSGLLHLKWIRQPQEFEKAAKYLQAAYERFDDKDHLLLPPEKEYILYYLGVALQRVGNLEEAAAALTEAMKLPLKESRRRFYILRLLGIIYSDQGKHELALTQYENARELAPDDENINALIERERQKLQVKPSPAS